MEAIITACVGLAVAYAAFGKGRLRSNLDVIRQYRLRHIAASLFTGAVVVAAATGLIAISPVFAKNPFLWLYAVIFHHGTGNGQANLIFSGLNWKWYAVVFLPVLALALPRLAYNEEIQYRAKTRNWLDGAWRSLRFGLSHMIMLIPFGASLALTLAGLWFTWLYFRGGVMRSAVYHAAFNTTLVMVIFVIVIVNW